TLRPSVETLYGLQSTVVGHLDGHPDILRGDSAPPGHRSGRSGANGRVDGYPDVLTGRRPEAPNRAPGFGRVGIGVDGNLRALNRVDFVHGLPSVGVGIDGNVAALNAVNLV